VKFNYYSTHNFGILPSFLSVEYFEENSVGYDEFLDQGYQSTLKNKNNVIIFHPEGQIGAYIFENVLNVIKRVFTEFFNSEILGG